MINNKITMNPEHEQAYEQAAELHRHILADAEIAASALISLAQNLKTMRDEKHYLALGHDTFEDYTEKAVGLKRRQAYTYISALEKLPKAMLEQNAHLGITKLELLAQVPALNREDFTAEHDLGEISVAQMEELVRQIKDQGEQLSILGAEKEEAVQQSDEYSGELAAARKRIAELEARPVEVAVQEPDKKMIDKIKKEAREKARADFDKQREKEIEEARKSERKAAEAEYDEKLKKSQETFEAALSEAAAKTTDLEKRIKTSGSTASAIKIYFKEINSHYNAAAELIGKLREENPEEAQQLKAALAGALTKLAEHAGSL